MAESGTIGAVPAIANAVGDALAAFCNGVNRIPLKPEYLRSLIGSGNRASADPRMGEKEN
jgi:CO/xanthine dehydrogenase Mo-binding subunit